MICPAGYEVSFTCPCCPEEFDDCRFKKLFKGGYIVRDGALYNGDTKFKLSDDKTHITLKECIEDDEGTYVWMCGRCNVNMHFHLEVQDSGNSKGLLLFNRQVVCATITHYFFLNILIRFAYNLVLSLILLHLLIFYFTLFDRSKLIMPSNLVD